MKKMVIYIIIDGIVTILVAVFLVWFFTKTDAHVAPSSATVPPPVSHASSNEAVTSTPEIVTVTGAYVCLPTLGGEVSADCAFGIKTDTGEYYAVNFGASAGSMADFTAGAAITAKGTLILRENLHPDSWKKFVMKGLFTVLEKQ